MLKGSRRERGGKNQATSRLDIAGIQLSTQTLNFKAAGRTSNPAELSDVCDSNQGPNSYRAN